jgi:hypothetical protein
VARGDRERRMQKALIHAGKPENRKLVLEALQKTGRMDLADRLTEGGLAPSGHLEARARKGGYVGPAFLSGGDAVVDADEAALDEHDGHFPEPGAAQVKLACGTKVPKHLAEAASRGGFDVSWKGRKNTATIKPLERAHHRPRQKRP